MNSFSDNVRTSKTMTKLTSEILKKKFKNQVNIISEYFEDIRHVVIRKFLIVNSFYFRENIFVIKSDHFFQIIAIFDYKESFVFLCSKFRAVRFHKFANCIEVQKSTEIELIKLSDIEFVKSYEGKFLFDKIQIIANNLDLLPTYKHLLLPIYQ